MSDLKQLVHSKMIPLQICKDNKKIGEQILALILEKSLEAVSEKGFFSIAFSGGSLPSIVCPDIVNAAASGNLDLSKWKIYFADERFVPLDHEDSNYLLLKQELLDKLPDHFPQVYPIDPTVDLCDSASAYAESLCDLPQFNGFPQFDLVLLGMGPDGHTASLFPDHPLLDLSEQTVAFIEDSPKPPSQRLTFTLPVLNNAKNVFFVATGSSKCKVLHYMMKNQATKMYPSSLVKPVGTLLWFVDESALSSDV